MILPMLVCMTHCSRLANISPNVVSSVHISMSLVLYQIPNFFVFVNDALIAGRTGDLSNQPNLHLKNTSMLTMPCSFSSA